MRILERYLSAYTTALKNQPFRLVYVDGFAGSGQVRVSTEGKEAALLIHGSAERAVGIEDKPFDRLVFIDKDRENCAQFPTT